MSIPYSESMRSFFKIDLVADDRKMLSTPPRLIRDCTSIYQKGSRLFPRITHRTWGQYVRIDKNTPFKILIRYQHSYPHPEAWRKKPYMPEWLVAQVLTAQHRGPVLSTRNYRIPTIERSDREDRAVLITANELNPSYDPDHDWYGERPDSVKQPADNTLWPCTSDDGDGHDTYMASECSDKVKWLFITPDFPSNGDDDDEEGKSAPYFDVVVRLYRSKSPVEPAPDAIFIDEFRLYCVESVGYRQKFDEAMADPVARKMMIKSEELQDTPPRLIFEYLWGPVIDDLKVRHERDTCYSDVVSECYRLLDQGFGTHCQDEC